MLSIAVCDDEVLDCCKIAGSIKEILKELDVPFIIRQFYSGKELLQAVGEFDIIFLDIMMGGMDGIETARVLRDKAYENILVFISSSRGYVFEAYDVEAFQYLVKPVEHGKLRSILQRMVLKLQKDSPEFILIQIQGQTRKLFLKNIFYFEIRGRVISAHSADGVFQCYGQIGGLEAHLQDKGFFRCHKSFLVNLNCVDEYGHQELILENGEKIPIAKRRQTAFEQELIALMKKSGGIS